jgi:alpha-amylase/alpha-mannosidase (GH57 family)
MELWHLTPDAPRLPRYPSAGEPVSLQAGTWPIEPGQSVWVETRVRRADGSQERLRSEAEWRDNRGSNSYWEAALGPFQDGDEVGYTVRGAAPAGDASGGQFSFRVGPKIHLALLWHQHQPLYKDLARKRQRGSYRFPWVRLHALRDYYGMAALLEQHPGVHVTMNLTPVLLWQIEDYGANGATDRALELTLRPAEKLSSTQREDLLGTFFEASWHTQIYPWPRYRELLEKRRHGKRFSRADLRDLQMWFNLAWFAPELQHGEIPLPDGSVASVRPWIEKQAGFSAEDLEAMVEEQYKILRNIVPLHRRLQDRGQIEVSTTPFFHPILPLLADTDTATIDRPGTVLPTRFARPADARAQVRRAVDSYTRQFGRAPRGMWPAEGAVGQSVVACFAEAGLEWIATDRGVLQRSGRFGYDTNDPAVLCQPHRAEDASGRSVAVFFRDTALSDAIGFHYQRYEKAEDAARDFVREVKERFAWDVDDPQNRVLCVALDGENAWGGYAGQGRPFLHALYAALAADPEIRTVTLAEYLEGRPERSVPAHLVSELPRVHDLFHASWIDEVGSAPGNDLGTWIGEPEENRAWDLLRQTAAQLEEAGATPKSQPEAYEALLAAEGSDWFWWFGDDQASDSDAEFDDLFRGHLKAAYRAAGRRPPRSLDRHIVPHAPVWTFTRPVRSIQAGDRLVVRTNCPGRLEWTIGGAERHESGELVAAGGVMAGVHRYGITLGPFSASDRWVEFHFHCAHSGCTGEAPCCRPDPHRVSVVGG